MKNKFFTILWLACLTLAAAKYPPNLQWREIHRGAITIIFPAECWQQAETALAGAESAYEKLVAFWRDQPRGRIRIILDDSTDQANGFATFFPFNLVGVNLSEPPPDSQLAAKRSWLDLVLTHELTHIFNLNSAAKPFLMLRRVFGSQPALYPAVQLPSWVIEGLAVYGESRFTEDGRLNHPPYALMLGAARRDNLFPDWQRLGGTPTAWPGPTAKYLFGAGFMQFLADKYGASSLRQYLLRATSRLVLLSSSRDFNKTFGAPLATLWEEYRNYLPAVDETAALAPGPEPLTKDGFSHQYPCPLGNGRLAYYHRDYRGRGAVVMLDVSSGQEMTLLKLDEVNSLSFAAKENRIYLSASEYFHNFNDFSDLYEFDIQKRHLKRLSRGQRLSQPVKKENSNEIFCVQRRDGQFFLAIFDPGKQAAKTLSRGFTGLSQLSLSPDQSLLSASVKPEGGPWGIGVFSSSGDLLKFISAKESDCRQPRWLDNQNFYFIQSGALTTRLAGFSLAHGKSFFLDDPRLSGLQQFALSVDGKCVYFTYFSGRGQEISKLSIANLPFSPLEMTVLSGISEFPPAAPSTPSRPYRFWRDLLPRWWAPAWRMGGDEFQAGILTGGQDALGVHSYSLEGYYGFSSQRANFLFSYVYDGLFPTLSLSYSDNTDYYFYSSRTQELKLVSLWPLRIRKRSQLYAYADLHAERRAVIDDWGTFEFPGSYNGFRLGLSFNSAREYYDSVSQSDGVRLVVQGAVHPAGLGNHWSNRNVQADLRQYIPLFRPGVLAWRLALARSWNAGNHYFSMGGFTAESGLGNSRPFKLLRGLDAEYYMGDRGWQFNLEYRLPLFKIEKAILPAVSLDRIWLNPFFDMGRLSSEYYSHPVAYSVGGEMVLRLAFGGAAAYDLAFGAAYGFGPQKQWWLYIRTGRSF
ncbi:MAG: hypothetical protein KJ808_01955 [Acidobacteria bacterium]|nr:hypothetical protein [Acidobacteriota bacterium]MCG2812045.1 hypothetical protein [Candidatus Aminicenantes bacterium]